LSRAHTDKGDLDAAYDALIRAIVHSPETYDDKLLDLGEAYSNVGQLEKSVALYQRLLSTKPDSYEAHVRLAVTYERLGMPEPAIAEFERALAIKPDAGMRAHVRALAGGEKIPAWGENTR
jgi:tetratricopeptide (TPR) repeat protein